MHARIVNVGGIFLVDGDGVGAEDFALHHLGKSEDRVQRRAQFVAHLREEPRLRDVGGLRAVARLVRDRFRLLKLADQRVLFGARLERCQRRRMQAMGEQREISFGGQREQRQHVIVERAAQHEIHRDRRRHRRGGRKCCDGQARREHARYRDHQQHQEHHQRVRDRIEARRVDQDRGPAQAVEQIEQDKSRPPFAGCRERGRLGEEFAAAADDGGMNAEQAAGPGRGRDRWHPEAEQQTGCHHQQHDDVGRRQARLGILPKQLAVESGAGSAGRR